MDTSIGEIKLSPVAVWVEPIELDENASNEQTMEYYFHSPSIAELRPVAGVTGPPRTHRRGLVRTHDGRTGTASRKTDAGGSSSVGTGQVQRFRTSLGRDVTVALPKVEPAGFAPLIEWRIEGEPPFLADEDVNRAFWDVGVHALSFGPPRNPGLVEIETYSVTITSHASGTDIVPEGESVTFEAVTDPPGYEDEITWLSSTKYGTATPVLGRGPTFTVRFDDAFGDDPTYGYFQWLGVQADNTRFNQDQKPLCIGAGNDCWTTASCATDAGQARIDLCAQGTSIPADFFALGSDSFEGVIAFGGDPNAQFDTKMRRSQAVCMSDGQFRETPLEIVEFKLTSCEDITVGGSPETTWEVRADLNQGRIELGDASAPNDIPDCSDNGVGLRVKNAAPSLPNCGQVSTMTVGLQITHPRVGDLVVTLRHIASDTSVTLMNRAGSTDPDGADGAFCTGDELGGNGNADLNVNFDDSAVDSIDDQTDPLTAGDIFRPTQPLSAFHLLRWCAPTNGDDAWELTITDARGSALVCSDGSGSCGGLLVNAPCSDLSGTCEFVPESPGSLDSWTLDFAAADPPPPGTMTITRQDVGGTEGGSFVSQFGVFPRLTFTTGDDPKQVRVLDTAVDQSVFSEPLDLSITNPAPWTRSAGAGTVVCEPGEFRDFSPGVVPPAVQGDTPCCVVVGHAGPGHLHITKIDCDGCNGACCVKDEVDQLVGRCELVEATVDAKGNETTTGEACMELGIMALDSRYMGDGTNCDDSDGDGIPDVFEMPRPPVCCDPPQNPWEMPTDPELFDTDSDGNCDLCEIEVLETGACDPNDPPAVPGPGCADCNVNGTCDECEVFEPCGGVDCNDNGIPDDCDPDGDNDGVPDDCDNCPGDSNPDQTDDDDDGFGAACDCDDNEPLANPGLTESIVDGNCADGIDNDCENGTDADDPDC